jgi:proton-dependent oligopeptide transporter, POT family
VFTLTPLRKITVVFAVAAASFVIPALVETWIAAGAHPTVWWQVLAYVLITAAEVMISITALEFSYTQAPARLKSFIMGLFYASVFLGNLFTALVNASIEKSGLKSALDGPAYYWFFVKCMAVTAVLFVFVAMFYKGRTYLQDDEEPVVADPHG